MRPLVRALCLVSVACALAAAGRAQVVRVPHTGRVLDKDKKPVAGAKITVASPGAHGGLDAGDVVRVDADADGRFRVQLQPTRSYVAWAVTPCEDAFAVSAPADVGSLPIELVAGGTKVGDAFNLTGVQAWKELGELSVEFSLYSCEELTIRAKVGSTGKVAAPPLPAVTGELRVFVADKLVHTTQCSLQGGTALPKPQRLAVRVADDKGQPIAKAVVERVVWTWPSQVGPFSTRPAAKSFAVATTGDDGTAEVLLAHNQDPFKNGRSFLNLLFRARHDGYAAGTSGFTMQAFCNGKTVEDMEEKVGEKVVEKQEQKAEQKAETKPAEPEKPDKERQRVLPFVLTAPTATPVKVLAAEGQMPALVQRIGYRAVPYQKTSRTSVVDGESVPVRDGVVLLDKRGEEDQNGSIELPSMSPPLPAGDPWLRSARPIPITLPATALDGGQLDLREVLPLRVQVLDAGAGPAIGARILCAAASGGSFLDPAFAMQLRADRSGRAVLPVLPGSWFVMAVMDDGIAHVIVDAGPSLGPQTLKLHAYDRMRVHAVDSDGKPVQGARFMSNGSSWTGGGSPEDEMLRSVAWQVSSWALQRAVSDANGNADLFFLAAKGMEMRLEAREDKRVAREMRLEAGDEPFEIVLK